MISLSPSLRRRMLGLDGELGIWTPDEVFWLAPKFVADTIVIPGCVDATDAIRACHLLFLFYKRTLIQT